MANKVPKFTISKHKQERNAFDLSQTHLFQAAPGMLYPILSLDCIPEDTFKINVVDFIKSMPVVNSPLCSARGVYEFFFVPYHQLWHNFDQFITQMSDYRSSYFALPESSHSTISTFFLFLILLAKYPLLVTIILNILFFRLLGMAQFSLLLMKFIRTYSATMFTAVTIFFLIFSVMDLL